MRIDVMDGSEKSWCGSGLRAAVAAAADLVLPSRCAACPSPVGPLCRSCRAGVREVGFAGGPRSSGPDPPPSGMPRCWSAARLDGPLRTAVTAYKDQHRRDLEPVLAGLLAEAVAGALSGEPALRRATSMGARVLVVPMPTSRASRRRRGDDPVGALAGRAVVLVAAGPGAGARSRSWWAGRQGQGSGLLLAPAVRHARSVVDQSGLGRDARARNLHGALVLDPRWGPVVRGSACVLVDDVVTTGASLTEAARVLWESGAAEVVAVTVAATARHGERTDSRSERVPLVAL